MATTLQFQTSAAPAVPDVQENQPQIADDGEGAFARYATAQMADSGGIKKDMRGARILRGRFKGKTEMEARELLRAEFSALDDAQKSEYAAMARGDDLKSQKSASSSLPFQPSSSMTGMDGKTVKFGPSASAPARAAAMKAQTIATAQAGKAAVKAAQANQAADPTGVAMRAQAAKDAVLAKDGVTDMGGGTMALQNQYGSGFAQKIDPTKPRAPGRIFDEKGEVDVTGMMLRSKGSQLDANGRAVGVPYMSGGSDAQAAGVSAGIQEGIASAAPGMEERRAKDIEKNATSFAASLPPAMQTPPIAMPTVPGATVPLRTANDTPGAASAAARAGMMKIKPAPSVADSVAASLPPSLRQPSLAKVQPANRPGPLPPSAGLPIISR